MSSSIKPEAFSFDTEFGDKGQVVRDNMASYKRYRQDEVDAACANAYQQGVQSVEAETERRIAATAEAIVAHLKPVLPFARNLAEQMRKEAAELAILTARKIAGAALDHVPEEAVKDCLSHMLSHLPEGARLILSVHPDIAERIEAAIMPQLPADTELRVAPDASAAPGSWKVSWDSGGFSHNPEELAERIEALLSDHLQQPVEEQGDLFSDVA